MLPHLCWWRTFHCQEFHTELKIIEETVIKWFFEFKGAKFFKIERSIVTSALDDNSYLKIPNEYYSESGGGISAKSEVFSRKNEVNSDKLLRLDYNTADHLVIFLWEKNFFNKE